MRETKVKTLGKSKDFNNTKIKRCVTKKERGITLIALVITIIVLLILAGVSIATLTGQNGILTRTNDAKAEQSHGAVKDGIILAYNEYQIEIKTASSTKIASKEIVTIQGEKEQALASIYTSFIDFLEQKGYVTIDDEDTTTGIINVEELIGSRQALGNGEDTDIYKIEEEDSNYVVNYYDEDGMPEEIWSISDSTSTETGEVTLEPDTGKEALILVYNVEAEDRIELPYGLKWYDDEYRENEYNATFDFTVDWGDGSTDNITNANITQTAVHNYQIGGEIKITITGIFECISRCDENFEYRRGSDKLIKVEQWGTTGLKMIDLSWLENLIEIAQPTQNSFKELHYVDFKRSGIQSIPDMMFYNCTNITNFDISFSNCNNLQSVGDNIFSKCTNITSFNSTFSSCGNLTNIGENIFYGCENVKEFCQTFYKCYNLEGNAPELWLRVVDGEKNGYIGIPDGEGCYGGCEKLNNYEEIPEYWTREFAE